MEIRQIRTFLQIVNLKSFTRAAEALGYTQANVSLQIKLLEEELGAVLFDRLGRHVSLTQQGEEFLPYAQQLIELSLKAGNLFRGSHQLQGSIRLGMVESIYESIAQEALLEYHGRYPSVRIDFTVDSTENLKRMLAESTLDAAYIIDDSLPSTEWKVWDVATADIVFAASASHPLANQKGLKLKDLDGSSLILMEQNASYTKHFLSELSRQNVNTDSFLHLQSPALACSMLKEHEGVTVIPRYSLNSGSGGNAKFGREPLTILDITDFHQTEYVQLVLNKNKTITPQIEGMLRILKDLFMK